MERRGRPKIQKPPLKKDKIKLVEGPKKDGMRGAEKGIAYEIVDKNFGVLQVRNSANAWWMDRGKVELLIKACKIDCTVLEACFLAGITEEQYYYFCHIHPGFYEIKKILNSYPYFKARNTLVKHLDDPHYALAYLERKKKDEFSKRQEVTGVDGKDLIPDRYGKMTDEELEAEFAKRCVQDRK
jgi:hypothetical protein